MIRKIALTVTSFAVLLLSLAAPAPAGAVGGTLDQSQIINGYGYSEFCATSAEAQTFTAGTWGMLDRVSVYLENGLDPATFYVDISIQKVTSEGLPSGQEVGFGRIFAALVPLGGAPGWVDFEISGTPVMYKGTKYAIVLSTTQGCVIWWAAAGDAYPRGSEAFAGSGAWASSPNDNMFKTFVIQDSFDQGQGRLSAALPVSTWYGKKEYFAQTFTAGLSGILDRVRLHLGQWTATGPVEVSIQKTVNGFPSGEEIGYGEIPASALPVVYSDWVDIGISSLTTDSVIVSAGTQYAIVLSAFWGSFDWTLWDYSNMQYMGGDMLFSTGGDWMTNLPFSGTGDAAFLTFVIPIATSSMPIITPCSDGICPSASGNLTPALSTERFITNFHFQEGPDGTVQGGLNFIDRRENGIKLKGCTTESAACRLTVFTFACTDQHAIKVEGMYTRRDGSETEYRLTLNGDPHGPGSFSLSTISAGGVTHTYNLMADSIIDVTCPPGDTQEVNAEKP